MRADRIVCFNVHLISSPTTNRNGFFQAAGIKNNFTVNFELNETNFMYKENCARASQPLIVVAITYLKKTKNKAARKHFVTNNELRTIHIAITETLELPCVKKTLFSFILNVCMYVALLKIFFLTVPRNDTNFKVKINLR